MKTRAELKRELSKSIAEGLEQQFLKETDERLSASQKQLHELRDERVRIKRLISVRERKLQDWKGKVPRSRDAAPTLAGARAELDRLQGMPCHCIGRLQKDTMEIHLEKEFARALTGIDGFEKVWVLMLVPNGLGFATGECVLNDQAVSCVKTQPSAELHSLYMQLVDVVGCDVSKGIVQISGLLAQGRVELLNQVAVIDVKPYLSYCEAWPTNNGR